VPSTHHRRRRAAQFLTILTATVVVAAGQSATPAHAEPDAPTGLDATTVPVLSWTPVAAAEKYEVQVDTDSGFGTPDWTVKTTNTRAVPTKALGGSQHWGIVGIVLVVLTGLGLLLPVRTTRATLA
jgi:hypothetical protein